MPNINKVVYGNQTLIDLTNSTLNAANQIANGVTAYDRSGTKLTGTLVVDSTYSVTKNLTDVSSSADDTKVIAGNSFFTRLAPIPNNYVISSITVTMGGVDVTSQVFTPDEGGGGGSSLGTKNITQNGTYNAVSDGYDGYSQVTVNVQGGITPTGTKSISISSNGTTTEDVTNYASAEITVNVPTGTARSSSDLTVSGATVTAPAGLYASAASKSVASGTAGTPTATKGIVSNHSVSVTPSVTNTTGYITGSTKTGTAVTVSASELVSGSETKTANGTYDVTNLAELVVNVSGTSKNTQVVQGTTRTTSSSMTAIGAEMTVSKTGTYDVYWSAFRSSTSGSYTYATQLYIGNTAYGSENSTWSNHVQDNHLSNVSLTANQTIRVRGRNSRGSSYYIYAPTLVIVEA